MMEKILKLGEAVSISKGKKHNSVFDKPSGKAKRYIQIEDLRNDSNLKYTEEEGVEVNKNDVIIAWDGANAGTIGFNLQGYIGSTLARLRIEESKVDSKYLGRFLRSKFNYLRNHCTGATIPHISKSVLENISVPIFAIKTQRKIAAILEKAESALEKRREANRLTDEFLKSAFWDMFGDPVRNPKGWTVKHFRESFNSIRYGTGSPPQYHEKGIPFIRATNVKNGTIIDNEMKYISSEDAKKIEKCRVSFGNLIIVRSGVNAGDCALIPVSYDGGYAAYDLVIELTYPSAVFYNHLINSNFGKVTLSPLKRRAGQPHLNADQIGSLKLISPPLSEQQKFSALVEKVERLKQKQRASETELQNLFNALMQRAFRGEL